MDKLKVAILGATGLVGQWFVKLLAQHPWFEISYLGASPSSAGRTYKQVVHWILDNEPPDEVNDMVVGLSEAEALPKNIDLVFSALPPEVALDIELKLVKEGFTVISNASPLRLEKDIPLIVPEVNSEHLNIIEVQKKSRQWKGVLIKNPNCTTIILTLALKPIYDNYGIDTIIVTSLQAVSGAGLYGVSSVSIIDNIVPFIPREEDKVENETRKILGFLKENEILPASFKVSAITTRVPVLDGHTIVVHAKLHKDYDVYEIINVLKNFKSLPQDLKLPTAPVHPIIVRSEEDRPQPRLDRYVGNGMSVVVGRIKKPTQFDDTWIKFVVLGHNVVRGAAGNSILIAEVYLKEYLGVI